MANLEFYDSDLQRRCRRVPDMAFAGALAVLRLFFLAALFMAYCGAVTKKGGERLAHLQASEVQLPQRRLYGGTCGVCACSCTGLLSNLLPASCHVTVLWLKTLYTGASGPAR